LPKNSQENSNEKKDFPSVSNPYWIIIS
jgi:hypothetical protein